MHFLDIFSCVYGILRFIKNISCQNTLEKHAFLTQLV